MAEAKEINGEIHLNGYFRATLIGFASFVIFCLSLLTTNVIKNDNKYMELITENKVSIATLAQALFPSLVRSRPP